MSTAKSLSFYRDGYQVFSGISFNVKSGSCFFIKGPNGSGKTTLLKLIAGFLPIQEGIITINGVQLSNNYDFIAQNTDYIGHSNAMKKQMTTWDNLKFWSALSECKSRSKLENEFEDLMIIDRFKNQIVSFCSAGQIRRAALSKLSVNNKKLWLLDEPTASLDQDALINFSKLIQAHCVNGGAAIIATHNEIQIPKINFGSIEMKRGDTKDKSHRFDPFLAGDW